MTRHKVSREDLVFALNDRRGVVNAAENLGVNPNTISAACKRYGISLLPASGLSPLEALKHANENLTPLEALENAYYVLEELSGMADSSCDWSVVNTTPQRRAILQLLYRHEGQVVRYETVMRTIYMHDQDRANIGSLRVQVCGLRKQIRGTGFSIETIPDLGYRGKRDHGVTLPWEHRKSAQSEA